MQQKLSDRKSEQVGAVVVVGGGIAGIQASLDLANSGFKVYLVERSSSIGGVMAQLDKTFPTNDCSMCILSPKMVDCGRHLNITIFTNAEIAGVSGEAGNFKVDILQRTRYIDPSKCTGCAECVAVCPIERADEFNAFLAKRKAIYRPFPQAYPNIFTIEKAKRAACTIACPGGINVQGYVALIANRKFREALELICESIAFPSVCGRVCHHPCETQCKRGEYDSPIAIMALKRYVADSYIEELPIPSKKASRAERVAIIGAGPAGLTAGFELAKEGFNVDVFDALPEPGGMLISGIPAYRLPREALRKDIMRIVKTGVRLLMNKKLGVDFSLADLKKQGYDAILLAIGAHKALKLGIKEEDTGGVIDGISFLRRINFGEKLELGRRVVVVGGGNAAIDCARVAKRMGSDVTILYRRTRKEMPANDEEINEALAEGIKIEYLCAPVAVKSENGKIVAVHCIRMKLGASDASGRPRPVPIEGSDFDVPADTLIPAISQLPELSDDMGVKFTEGGTIETHENSAQTSLKRVFACGDAVYGPKTVIEAIAAGKNAAREIIWYLDGKKGVSPISKRVEDKPPRDFPIFIPSKQRVKISELEPEVRIHNFDEVQKVLSEEEAVTEAQRCIACGICSECMQCVAICKAKAITHDAVDVTIPVNAGAIILAAGYKPFDPSGMLNLGKAFSGNIVTSVEFERILSASGPYGGHLVRPGDGKPVKKIAFIQCVGSRDEKCGHRYCSSVCCMYAVKEAIIAREHQPGVTSTIFYMDLRAYGKEFDKYIERGASQYGVTFKRSRVSRVCENSEGNIVVQYEDEQGAFNKETFDMVVLAVGLEPGADFPAIAEKLGIELNEHGFFKAQRFAPQDATRKGVFLCGVVSEPKDIPESVTQASAASARVQVLLAEERGKLATTKVYPPERDVSGEAPRIGVFVCHCGINIGGIVNVPSVAEYASTLPNVVYVEENLYTCSQDTQEKIKAVIFEKQLNRIVVASCSPRTHEPLFQETMREAGLNPHLFEMANIRDQCSWVHMFNKPAATAKSKDLVRMAVHKVRIAKPLKTSLVPVAHSAMVVGGGLSGMTSALTLADQGYEVILVEKTASLGGNLLRLNKTADGYDVKDLLNQLVLRVKTHPKIKCFLQSEVTNVSGFVGNYETVITTTKRKTKKQSIVHHGVAIIATGASEAKIDEYLYGKNKKVLTMLEFEAMLADADKRCFVSPKSVAFILCVGSREPQHPYCSRVCCTSALKNAILLKRISPETQVWILYRDIRAYGFRETYYTLARELGVEFIRYEPQHKPEVIASKRTTKVVVYDTLLGKQLNIPVDNVVLAVRIDPAPDNEDLAKLFKVPLSADRFFLEAHAKLRPVDFATEGVFLCGMAHYPKDISESICQALASAGRAGTILSKESIEAEARIARVRAEYCSGCGACVDVCPYKAVKLDELTGLAVITETVCKGCGTCSATCRCGAIDVSGFMDGQINEMLNVMTIPDMEGDAIATT